MPEQAVTIGSVVINVIDLEREKEFWTALLGVGVDREVPGFFLWLEPQHRGGISLALQKVNESTPGRNPVHIDAGVSDLAEAATRVEALGGSHIEDHEFADFRWKVMADPEGNEFCIAMEG